MSVARHIRTARRVQGFFLPIPLLVGCSRAPSIDILGSFFPAWLVCFILAIVLTALVQFLIARFHVKVALPILMYLGLATFFTFALWLVFFY